VRSPRRAAVAQQTGRSHRIGILGNVPPTEPWGALLWGAFIQGLRDHGYTEGQNISIEHLYSEGKYERLVGLADELVRRRVEVIVVPADQNALAARRASRTIPIVMIGDPVGSGLVASLARPGGNITGLSGIVGPEIVGKQLELLKAIVPHLSRVAILRNPGNPLHAVLVREAGNVARWMMLELHTHEARGPDDFPTAFAVMARDHAGAVLVLSDGMFGIHPARIADLAAKGRLPTMGTRIMVDAGVLMTYSPKLPDLFRRAATYVDKILRGAKPADLPIEQPTAYELVINMKIARALGLTIPAALRLQADQVVE
jgi:putative tryptophan/tyrosine transport system substrate-binding protein